MSYVQNASLSHALLSQTDQGTAQLWLQAQPKQSVCGEQNGKWQVCWHVDVFLCKHGHPDIVPAIAYLRTWVQKPNHADWTMLC